MVNKNSINMRKRTKKKSTKNLTHHYGYYYYFHFSFVSHFILVLFFISCVEHVLYSYDVFYICCSVRLNIGPKYSLIHTQHTNQTDQIGYLLHFLRFLYFSFVFRFRQSSTDFEFNPFSSFRRKSKILFKKNHIFPGNL